ncbi:MAG TPA: fructose bisphosphate aldolase [Ruminococcaceae bacterium]|nr:fructose bisphosphate aldolase [Oscillospiraceae bacterium]
MNQEQRERIQVGKGFIAALDQSGGSSPKALASYGVEKSEYANDKEMFDLIHKMRTRIIKSPAFESKHILAAILFENTMNRQIDGKLTADYLWDVKGVVPFLKVDKGLASLENGVQVMKPMPGLDDLLKQAVEKHIFGTKMRSVIKEANPTGIHAVVDQQFAVGAQIAAAGLVPILEPEVDIHSADKQASEKILKKEILAHLSAWKDNKPLMLKLSLPTEDNFYRDVIEQPQVLRVVALSGGYSREEANAKLAKNHGLIASFSRALTEGLNAKQTDAEFNKMLTASVQAIYNASIA